MLNTIIMGLLVAGGLLLYLYLISVLGHISLYFQAKTKLLNKELNKQT